jgi:ATP-dependent DNA helicase RecG
MVRQPGGSRFTLGCLLIGREASLRQWCPRTSSRSRLAEQAVRFNEFRNFPLLKAIDWLETNFLPYNPEEELQVGLFRVPVPRVDIGAFREAVANALIHRDYYRLGAVHVRLENDALVVSIPWLVDGVTVANLLTTEPRPRNRYCRCDASASSSARRMWTIIGASSFGRPAGLFLHRRGQRDRPAGTDAAESDFRRLSSGRAPQQQRAAD